MNARKTSRYRSFFTLTIFCHVFLYRNNTKSNNTEEKSEETIGKFPTDTIENQMNDDVS